MSVPALLSPVRYQGRNLVDVGSSLFKPEDVDSIGSVTGQMINILTEQNANASRALLKPDDVYIKPDLEGITAADFNKFREGAERGRKAVQAVADKLQRYALPEAQLNRDIGHIYGDGDYESVDYSLLTTRDHNILRITPTEKSWGPNYLRFGVEMEASAKENEIGLRVAYHKKWLNSLGAEWLTSGQIGERKTIFTEFYQPLDVRQRFFVEPAIGLSRDSLNIYQNDNRIAEYEVKEKS